MFVLSKKLDCPVTHIYLLRLVQSVYCDVISSGPAFRFHKQAKPAPLVFAISAPVSPVNVKENLCQLVVTVNGKFLILVSPLVG